MSSTEELKDRLAAQLPPHLGWWLPNSIVLYSDRIEPYNVTQFLRKLSGWLEEEFHHREQRLRRFIELKLFNIEELKQILTARRQPWVLCWVPEGGLASFTEAVEVIPCKTMPNHGLAYRRGLTWLTTAPMPGEQFTADEIGHESAHAAFAAVSLVSQIQGDKEAKQDLATAELAVVTVRGESRVTPTGLPVLETRSELEDYLGWHVPLQSLPITMEEELAYQIGAEALHRL